MCEMSDATALDTPNVATHAHSLAMLKAATGNVFHSGHYPTGLSQVTLSGEDCSVPHLLAKE